MLVWLTSDQRCGYREIVKNERARANAHPTNIIHIILPLSRRSINVLPFVTQTSCVTRTSDLRIMCLGVCGCVGVCLCVWQRERYNIHFTLLQHKTRSSVRLADRRGIYRYHVSGINSFNSSPSPIQTYICYCIRIWRIYTNISSLDII